MIYKSVCKCYLYNRSNSLVSECPVLGRVLAVLLLIAGGEGIYDHCQHVYSNRESFMTGGEGQLICKIDLGSITHVKETIMICLVFHSRYGVV